LSNSEDAFADDDVRDSSFIVNGVWEVRFSSQIFWDYTQKAFEFAN
jgi:hypothetical protein